MADMVAQFRALIGKAELTELRPRPDDAEPKAKRRGQPSLRQMILDKVQEGQIGMFDGWALTAECDARLQADGVKFGSDQPKADEPAPSRPERRDLPWPFVMDRDALLWCSKARTVPREPVRAAETLDEQGSRINNHLAATALAKADGRELDERDRQAIWYAVCAQTAMLAKRAMQEAEHGG